MVQQRCALHRSVHFLRSSLHVHKLCIRREILLLLLLLLLLLIMARACSWGTSWDTASSSAVAAAEHSGWVHVPSEACRRTSTELHPNLRMIHAYTTMTVVVPPPRVLAAPAPTATLYPLPLPRALASTWRTQARSVVRSPHHSHG